MRKRHNVPPNPLYLLDSDRVGCWPCIFANKKSLRILARENPERIDEISAFEREDNEQRRKRDPNAPYVARFSRDGVSMPIKKVVEWAHYDRSGKEMFASGDRETGCMRWGLCEIQHPVSAKNESSKKRRTVLFSMTGRPKPFFLGCTEIVGLNSQSRKNVCVIQQMQSPY